MPEHLLGTVLSDLCLDRLVQKFPDKYGSLVRKRPLEPSGPRFRYLYEEALNSGMCLLFNENPSPENTLLDVLSPKLSHCEVSCVTPLKALLAREVSPSVSSGCHCSVKHHQHFSGLKSTTSRFLDEIYQDIQNHDIKHIYRDFIIEFLLPLRNVDAQECEEGP